MILYYENTDFLLIKDLEMEKKMLLTNILSLLIFPAVVLFDLKVEKRNDVINVSDSNIMKGVAAMFILFAHFYNQLSGMTDIGIGKAWLYMGGVGVCIFFFLSGYGLNRSDSIQKPGFIVKRLKSVLIPFIIIRCICFLINYPFKDKEITFFVGYILGLLEPQWFVSVILIIYIGYYVCYKMFGRKRLNYTVFLYNVGIGILFFLLGADPRWYNAHLLFSVGMIVADYNDSVINALKRINWWLVNVIIGGGFFCFAILFSTNKGCWWSIVFKLVSGMLVCLLFMNLFLRVRFRSNVIQWIGQNSLLFYIIHLQILGMPFMHRVGMEWYLLEGLLITVICISCYNVLKKLFNLVRT